MLLVMCLRDPFYLNRCAFVSSECVQVFSFVHIKKSNVFRLKNRNKTVIAVPCEVRFVRGGARGWDTLHARVRGGRYPAGCPGKSEKAAYVLDGIELGGGGGGGGGGCVGGEREDGGGEEHLCV
jgi:hypothetical protein